MRLRLLILALALLSSILAGRSAPPVLAATSTQVSVPIVLYHWKLPKKGHLHGWTITRGVAGYNGSADSTLLPPFVLQHQPNFAVQARMRGLGPSSVLVDRSGFGMVVRTVATDPHTSVEGGSFFSGNFADGTPRVPEDNNPDLYWNGQTAGEGTFTPGTGWHIYRLEVRGDQYSLWIDGKSMVRYTIPDYPDPSYVGVFSTFYRVQVSSLEVDRLTASTTRGPTNPLLRQANLTLSDLPTDWFAIPDLQHWYTNVEIARERIPPVPTSEIDSSGRVSGFGVDFNVSSRDAFSVYSTVSEYTTPEAAQAWLKDRRQHFLDGYVAPNSGQSNLHHFGDLGVGDLSDAVSVDFASINGRALLALATRGRYAILIRLGIDSDLSPDVQQSKALAVQLTGIIDQRIQRSGV